MEQVGFVIKTYGDKAQLEIRRSSGWGGCKGCASSCDEKSHIIILKNSLDAKVGDLVEIEGEAKNILKYAFIAYMIPFIFLILGITLSIGYFKNSGYASYELLSFGVGLVSLFISFFIVRALDRNIAKNDKDSIRMTRII